MVPKKTEGFTVNNIVTEEFNISSPQFKMTSNEFVPSFQPNAPAFIPAPVAIIEKTPVPEIKPEPVKPVVVTPPPPKKSAQELKLENKLTSMG